MTTDRKKIKDQQEGVYGVTQGISNAKTAVQDLHSYQRDFQKRTTENAATTVALSPLFGVPRKSRIRDIGIAVTTNVATNTTDFAIINFYKRTAGTSTFLGSWNSAATTQGALTTNANGHITPAVGLVVNSDADIAAGSMLQWNIAKGGAGQLIDVGTIFTFDLEAI